MRDYAIATRTTLRELMERYLTEVVPSHKGADIEATRIRRLLRDEAFVDKKLAALVTEDLQDYIQDRLTQVAPATVDREPLHRACHHPCARNRDAARRAARAEAQRR